MNNAARKENIYVHRIPDFGFIKHKNDRWRLMERLRPKPNAYLVTYTVQGICDEIELSANSEDVSIIERRTCR